LIINCNKLHLHHKSFWNCYYTSLRFPPIVIVSVTHNKLRKLLNITEKEIHILEEHLTSQNIWKNIKFFFYWFLFNQGHTKGTWFCYKPCYHQRYCPCLNNPCIITSKFVPLIKLKSYFLDQKICKKKKWHWISQRRKSTSLRSISQVKTFGMSHLWQIENIKKN
jgi:hypothetical protein